MEGLRRKQTELGEAIAALDAKLAESQGDLGRAFASLGETEIAFVAAEVQKCLENPRYYLENYHFIRTKKLGLVPLWPFWDAQEMFMASFERQMKLGETIRIICLKARQLGLTTMSVSLMCWLAFFHPNCHVLSMSDEEDRTDVNFSMARTAWDNLPWWMRPEKRYDIRGALLGFDRAKESERRISLGLQSQIYFESANQPSGAAYSKSLYGAHLAEVSRYRNANPITEGIFGSLVELPNSIGIMESTARGRGGAWHRICKASESGALPWDFVFLEWFREPGYRMTVPEGFEKTQDETALTKKVMEEHEFTMTDDQLVWRRKKMSEFEATDGDAERFRQEFPISPAEAFIASGRTAFSKKRLQDMLTHFCRPPNWTGEIRLEADDKKPRFSRIEDGRFRIWEFPKAGETYYIGADPSMGVEGGDPACAQVVCIPDDINKPIRQVAEWHGWIGPGQFARVLAAIGYLYNTAEISPECNTITTVVSDLCKVLMYPKWYRWMREDKAKNMYSNFIGWQTTFRNKNELLGRFRSALDEWTIIIRSEADVDEMFDFVEVEEGSERYEARIGAHDDRVMCFSPDTKVTTGNGEKPISEIVPGDIVLGHDSQWHVVNGSGSRSNDESTILITLSGWKQSPIRCTGNHPFWCKRRRGSAPVRLFPPEWVRADALRENDFLYCPKRPLDHASGKSSDILYLMGWYVSDGYVSPKNLVRFTFGGNEIDCARKIANIITGLMPDHPTEWRAGVETKAHRKSYSKVRLRNHGKFIRVSTVNQWLARFLITECGGPKAKRVPPYLHGSCDILPFVVGFLEGDGSQAGSRGEISAFQKTHRIIEDIRNILIDHGIWSTQLKNDRNGLAGMSIGAPWVNRLLGMSPSARFHTNKRVLDRPIAREDDGGFWIPIRSIRDGGPCERVYNLSVEYPHTYTANRIAAHNSLMIAYYCATQLRPRMDGSLEENKPPSDQDFSNTDFSPIYDNKDDIAQDRTGVPDFFML